MTNSEYLEKTKLLLGITEGSGDDLLSFLIADCVVRVLGYCRIDERPTKLESLIPVMAAGAYRVGSYGQEQETAGVSKLQQGERAVWYDTGEVKRDDWINDFKSRLDPFRNRKGRVPSDLDKQSI